MERRYSPAEKHPLLAACNTVTIAVGFVLALQALIAEIAVPNGGISSTFLLGVIFLFLGTITGRLTNHFHHWDYGLTIGQKLFASLSIFAGALAVGWFVLGMLNTLYR